MLKYAFMNNSNVCAAQTTGKNPSIYLFLGPSHETRVDPSPATKNFPGKEFGYWMYSAQKLYK